MRRGPRGRFARLFDQFFGRLRELFGRRRSRVDQVVMLPADRIEPNPFQPRGYVDPDSLRSLSESIRSFGLIVPIIVREDAGRWILVAGQRRLAACRMLGMRVVPALVRELSADAAVEAGYLENAHREAMKPVEEARVIERLHVQLGLPTALEAARLVGLEADEASSMLELLEHPVLLREAMVMGLVSPEESGKLRGIRDRRRLIEAIRRIQHERSAKERSGKNLRKNSA